VVRHATCDRQQKRPEGMTLEYVEARFTVGPGVSRLRLPEKGLTTPEVFADL